MTPTATRPMTSTQEVKAATQREKNIAMARHYKAKGITKKKPKKKAPSHLAWFSKLPLKHRLAIRKAWEQATTPPRDPEA